MLVKVVNESTVKKPLRILSPQSGYVSSGAGRNERNPKDDPKIVERFLEVEIYKKPPMTEELSGLGAEYADRAHLLDRSRQARGDHRLRRRPGEPGRRLPRRDARCSST